jgi:flagellar basal body rod protein FlgB
MSQGLLEQAAQLSQSGDSTLLESLSAAAAQPQSGEFLEAPGSSINLDEEVADMASANLKYQALTESLNRHFGLMHLAISGRS